MARWRPEVEACTAVAQAKKPNFDRYYNEFHITLKASGLDVGLPDGQMGNSEAQSRQTSVLDVSFNKA